MKLNKFLSLLAIFLVFGCTKSESQKPVNDPTYPIGKITTSQGDMYFWLYDQTPNHKAKFIELAEKGFYNSFTMNRVVKNFVIQGGCPDSVQYFEGSPYLLDPEFVDTIGHKYGALGMGRDDNPKKQSNACQFYVVNKESGLPSLDKNYMIFGQLIKGYDVLETIEKVPTNSNDMPNTPITLAIIILNLTALEIQNTLGYTVTQ
jgi:peptidyl-prolyl cis-trans isomerase B (cyclophilin B)